MQVAFIISSTIFVTEDGEIRNLKTSDIIGNFHRYKISVTNELGYSH